MSHKKAKLQRKAARMTEQDEVTIVIRSTGPDDVRVTFPANIPVTLYMMGRALEAIGQQATYKPPSPIVQMPPGTTLGKLN